jgi:sigma-B regulation protein RsbU (phosphoserine phosphatase)
MASERRVVLFDAAPPRARNVLARLQDRGLTALRVGWTDSARVKTDDADVAVLVLDEQSAPIHDQVRTVLDHLTQEGVAALVWGHWTGTLPASALVENVAADVPPAEVVGRLAAMARYGPLVRRLDDELAHLQRLSAQAQRYFGEIDHEMRLAGRLQRDFLPRSMPVVEGLRFATLYRPASWVSGDLFDVFRLDPRHIGLFVADVMGHGTSAALMTMFVRQALGTQVSEAGRTRVLAPSEALTALHRNLAEHKLPNQQYITAVYAIYDVETHEVTVARGGHPHPLCIRASGSVEQCAPLGGSLLGLADLEPEFCDHTFTLAPHDKFLLYTDGLQDELMLRREAEAGRTMSEWAVSWAGLDVPALTETIASRLDVNEGSLHPIDDVTLVGMERL